MFAPFTLNRGTKTLMAAVALAGTGVVHATDVKIPDTTITASLRSSFVHTDYDTSKPTADFALNSFNVYMNSKITEKIKFSFSSEFQSGTPSTPNIQVQDAIAQYEDSPTFNLWAGRFLPPTDRANSYGPYYANNWNFAADGTQDGYPFIYGGRADGVAYWGDFADTKLKVSAGVFDVPSTLGKKDVLAAARVQYDFWDAEPGYYLNGTYLGDKDILALAVATNVSGGKNTSNADFLMEKKIGDGGAFTVEGEYIKYNKLGGYDSRYLNGNSYFITTSYLFPAKIGIGKIQLLGKFGSTDYKDGMDPGTSGFTLNTTTGAIDPPVAASALPDYKQDTTEFNLNYIMKSFNARASLFLKTNKYGSAAASKAAGKEDFTQIGLGVQLMTL